jgi:Heme oxygenase
MMQAQTVLEAPPAEAGRLLLRRSTRCAHASLEEAGLMAPLVCGVPDRDGVARAVAAQFRVYAAVEPALRAARPSALARHPGYRPRAPLAAADLARLGIAPPPAPRIGAPFRSDAAWWGWFYVVDGSSLGGAIIGRRLATLAPDLPPLSFFDPYGADRGRVWGALRGRLDEAMADPEVRREALAGARAAFALFAEALGADEARAAAS